MPRPALLSLLLAACATGPSFVHPGQPSPAQLAELRTAEQAYRKDAPEFPAQRDALAKDPVTAYWLTRMVVFDLVQVRGGREESVESQAVPAKQVPEVVRDGQPADAAALLRAATNQKDPRETRALAQIDALGAAAVPCLVVDLIRHKQSFNRQLGCELLARIGRPALPVLEELRTGDAVSRRTYAQLAARMTIDGFDLEPLRRQCTADADFTVRAASVAALPAKDPASASLVYQVLARDQDAFVRRAAAAAAAQFRTQASVEALIAYLERCLADDDRDGEKAAQEALQRLFRAKGRRSAADWRSLAPKLDGAAGK